MQDTKVIIGGDLIDLTMITHITTLPYRASSFSIYFVGGGRVEVCWSFFRVDDKGTRPAKFWAIVKMNRHRYLAERRMARKYLKSIRRQLIALWSPDNLKFKKIVA